MTRPACVVGRPGIEATKGSIMSFEFTVLPDSFVKFWKACWTHPGPNSSTGTSCSHFGWAEAKRNVFTSDIHPIGFPLFTHLSGSRFRSVFDH